MLNIADVVILVLIALGVWYGVRQGFAKEVVVALGVLLGAFSTAVAYGKLAFLSEGSGTRAVLLIILMLALLLLFYSVSLTLGGMLERRVKKWRGERHATFWKQYDRFAGGLVAGAATCVLLWVMSLMFVGIAPSGLQHALQNSKVLGTVEHALNAPPVFREIVHLLQPFNSPVAFAGNEPAFDSSETTVDQEFDALDSAAQRAQASVVKIQAWGCGSTSEGSGFLVGKRLIMTNAHIIAGAERITVQDGQATYVANAVWFDPSLDDAVLRTTTDLSGAPLALQTNPLKAGAIGAVLGYPDGGALTVRDATVLQLLKAVGYDIYGKNTTERNIYALRATIQPGSSGSPLLNSGGQVAGLVFGSSTTQTRTGYAIAASQLAEPLRQAANGQQVNTGNCAGG